MINEKKDHTGGSMVIKKELIDEELVRGEIKSQKVGKLN